MPTPVISGERLAAAYTYAFYRHMVGELVAKGQTTGTHQSEELVHYTRLNEQRMSRLDKTVQVLPDVAEAARRLTKNYIWLVITEGWCGDAAQLVSIFEAVATASEGHIETRYLLRDENPDIMANYLTNGGQAIPQLVVLHADTLTEAAHWGPRPAPAQALVVQLKSEGVPHEELATQLHTWYARDKTQTTQHELKSLIEGLH